MPCVERLPCCRLARPDGDHVGWVLLREQPDVRRAGELEADRLLTVVAQAIAHAGGEALVGDADVLPDPETGNARECARRRLENEAHRTCLPLRGQLVVEPVQHDRLGLPDAEAVLEEGTARDVVLEELREAALASTHRLVDGLRLFLGGLADEDLAGLLGAAERFVLRFGPARERVHEIRRRRVDVPLDDRPALHVHEYRARVAAEDVLVIAVDLVVALLSGGGATAAQDPFRLQPRRVRVGTKVREVDAAEAAMPIHVVPLSAPEVLLRLTYLGRRIEDAPAGKLLAHDEHPLLQAIGLGVLREEVAPERRDDQGGEIVTELVPRLRVALRGVGLERPLRHLGVGPAGDVDPLRRFLEDPRILERRRLDEVGLRDRREELLEPTVLVNALIGAGPRAELFAVVRVDDEARAFIRSHAKLLDRLTHVAERDEVAKLHASGEDDQRETLVFGDIRLAELLRAKTRLKKVLVVEHRVRDARLREKRRKVRLPDAFRQPCSERPLSEDRVYTIGKRPNLGDAIAPRHADEDRLVVTTGKKLDLTPPDEVRQVADDVRAVGFQPVEEGP